MFAPLRRRKVNAHLITAEQCKCSPYRAPWPSNMLLVVIFFFSFRNTSLGVQRAGFHPISLKHLVSAPCGLEAVEGGVTIMPSCYHAIIGDYYGASKMTILLRLDFVKLKRQEDVRHSRKRGFTRGSDPAHRRTRPRNNVTPYRCLGFVQPSYRGSGLR